MPLFNTSIAIEFVGGPFDGHKQVIALRGRQLLADRPTKRPLDAADVVAVFAAVAGLDHAELQCLQSQRAKIRRDGVPQISQFPT